jgi:hypothetical protein
MGERRDRQPRTKPITRAFQLPQDEQSRIRFLREGYLLVPQSLHATLAGDVATAARELVDASAASIDRRGTGARLIYRVVTGERIASDAPMLFGLYSSTTLLEWVRHVTGCRGVSRSPHLPSSVNLNCLTTRGDEYAAHRDAVPYTVLLFLSDVAADAGGQLLIQSLQGNMAAIQPRLGQLVLMDGARCRHAVAPLRQDTWRVTMPMVFPRTYVERPPGLDDYLYRP